jgi:RNA polymerase sigma-70 factor (ECF subfamily)
MTFQRNDKRRPRGIPVDEVAAGGVADAGPDEAESREARINMLYACINELKKDDRALILLHLDGKSYEESAEILGISKSNTGVKILRIKKKLQECLIQKGYERD